MAHDGAPDRTAQHDPAPLQEALQLVLSLPATNPGQQAAQREITSTLEAALDARRQRIIVSRAEVNAVKWSCLYLQAICALLAIALVHCDDWLSSLVAMGLFATGVSASVLLTRDEKLLNVPDVGRSCPLFGPIQLRFLYSQCLAFGRNPRISVDRHLWPHFVRDFRAG